MSNRVEELESTVAELQAAVDGLTEELGETRERLRQLEDEREAEPTRTVKSAHAERVDASPDSGPTSESKPTADEKESAEQKSEADAADTATEDADATEDDEIIVA